MDTDLQAHLVALETQLLQPEVRGSRARLDALLADGFREIGASGCLFGKDEVLRRLPQERGVAFAMRLLEMHAPGPGLALLVYEAERMADGISQRSLRSSLWQQTDDDWRILFHQGTPLPAGATIAVS